MNETDLMWFVIALNSAGVILNGIGGLLLAAELSRRTTPTYAQMMGPPAPGAMETGTQPAQPQERE